MWLSSPPFKVHHAVTSESFWPSLPLVHAVDGDCVLLCDDVSFQLEGLGQLAVAAHREGLKQAAKGEHPLPRAVPEAQIKLAAHLCAHIGPEVQRAARGRVYRGRRRMMGDGGTVSGSVVYVEVLAPTPYLAVARSRLTSPAAPWVTGPTMASMVLARLLSMSPRVSSSAGLSTSSAERKAWDSRRGETSQERTIARQGARRGRRRRHRPGPARAP